MLAAVVTASFPTDASESEHAATSEPALREARWWVLRDATKELGARDTTAGTKSAPTWDPEVTEALKRAALEATAAGSACIGVAALLSALLRSSHPAVQTLAKTTHLDITAAASAVPEARPSASERPFTPLTDTLSALGVVDRPVPLLVRWLPALIRQVTSRPKGWSGPIMIALQTEILRQAVITNQPSVQAAHLLLAIQSMQEQLDASGVDLIARYRRHNQGGILLKQSGNRLRPAQQYAEQLPHDRDVLTPSDAHRRLVSTSKLGDPLWTFPAATAMDHAAAIARRLQHRDTGTTHLLAAALTDRTSTASLLLESLGTVASLRNALHEQLGTPQ